MSLAAFDLQHAPCGVFTFNDALVMLAVNQTLADMLGVSPDELVGKSLDQLLTPSHRLLFHMQVITRLHVQGHVDEMSLSLAAANSVEIAVLLNAVRREQAGGAVTECIVIRVNERKRLEDELFRVKKATEMVPGAVYQYLLRADGTSCFPYTSEGIREIYGLSPMQMQQSAERVFQRIHPDDIPKVRASIEASAKTLSPWHQEYRVNLPKRGVRWLEGHAVPELRSDASIIWHGYISDITERRALAAELAREHERTRVTLQSIGDAVIITNALGEVEYINPIAERLTGWRQPDAVGQPVVHVFNIVNQHTRAPAENPVTRCLAERSVVGTAANTVLIALGGQEYAVEDSAAPIFNAEGEITGTAMVFRDVTDQRKQRQEVEHRATHDHLTGLPNRAEFERISTQLFDSTLTTGVEHAVCCIDLDQFKIVNDSCGHAAGDLLLRQVADLLLTCVRTKDTVARLGGDEFALLLERCDSSAAQRIAQNICKRVSELRFQHSGKVFRLGASIGLAPLDRRWENAQAAQQAADSACFAAKAAGRGQVCVYEEHDDAALAQHAQLQWATRLQQALDDDLFVLFAQPIQTLDADARSELQFEVLLRLRDVAGGLILPGAFFPAAERYGLAPKIDRWVVSHAYAWLLAHPEAVKRIGLMTINLSVKSLGDRSFQSFVCDLLDQGSLPPEKFCFEVSETAATENRVHTQDLFAMLSARGARISLDDYGSDLSSLAAIKRLPVDYIKINGQLVQGMATDAVNCAMVRSIHEISHLLGKRTIAKWVEGAPVLTRLQALGVDFAQGHHLGRPQPIDAVLEIK